MTTTLRLTMVATLLLLAGCASLPTSAKPACGVDLPTFRNDAPLDAAHMNEIARVLRCLDARR